MLHSHLVEEVRIKIVHVRRHTHENNHSMHTNFLYELYPTHHLYFFLFFKLLIKLSALSFICQLWHKKRMDDEQGKSDFDCVFTHHDFFVVQVI